MRYYDIPQYTKSAPYRVNISWDYLPEFIVQHVTDYGLDLNPDFQRGYVWTPEQKTRYIEFVLRGGRGANEIQTNCPGWSKCEYPLKSYVLVDGKQRLDAVMGFLANEVPAFGHFHRDFTGPRNRMDHNFLWHVNDLPNRDEVLQWYLDLNSGGTVHTEMDLSKVREMLGTPEPPTLDLEARKASAGLNREPFASAVTEWNTSAKEPVYEPPPTVTPPKPKSRRKK